MTSPTRNSARPSRTASMTCQPAPAGLASGPTTTHPRSRSRPCAPGGTPLDAPATRAPTATHLRRPWRVQRITGPGLEDRARSLRRRYRVGGDCRPPTAGDQPVEQDRAPTVLPDHLELARTTADQPPSHHRPDRQHQNSNRPERPRRPGHRPIPNRHQLQRPRHSRPTPGPTRLPRRLELHPAASRHAIATGLYFFADT